EGKRDERLFPRALDHVREIPNQPPEKGFIAASDILARMLNPRIKARLRFSAWLAHQRFNSETAKYVEEPARRGQPRHEHDAVITAASLILHPHLCDGNLLLANVHCLSGK